MASRAVLAELNTEIRKAADQFDAAGPSALWQFRCECVDPACETKVEITLREYDELRKAEAPIIAPGHTLRRAEFVAEATQQIRRAQKNRRPAG